VKSKSGGEDNVDEEGNYEKKEIKHRKLIYDL